MRFDPKTLGRVFVDINGKERVLDVYHLNNIVRYNNAPRIHTETVAAHSFFVIYFVHMLCQKYSLPGKLRLQAMELAMAHDIPEVIINDITHDAKETIPGLASAVVEVEDIIVAAVTGKETFHPVVRAIVEAADILSVFQYVDQEVNCFNNIHMASWLPATGDRADKALKRLDDLVMEYYPH